MVIFSGVPGTGKTTLATGQLRRGQSAILDSVATLESSLERLALLDVHTVMYGVDFLSEIGHVFNRDKPLVASKESADHLVSIVGELVHD